MKLGIVGTGAMGQVLLTCAKSDPDIGQIFMIEPTQKESWPDQKLDLLIDFSHPHAICGIYEYCRARGGNIPVVLATTGYNKEEEEIIHMLQKICPRGQIERKGGYPRCRSASYNKSRYAERNRKESLPAHGYVGGRVFHARREPAYGQCVRAAYRLFRDGG